MSRNVTGYNPPQVDYKALTVNGVNYLTSNAVKVSFVPPYNTVSITFRPNVLLNRYIVNATYGDAAYDIDVGKRLVAAPGGSITSIPSTQDTTVSFEVNSTNFDQGDGLYRISLYAQSAVDYSWDVSYILLTVSNDTFVPSDGGTFEVLTTKIINS